MARGLRNLVFPAIRSSGVGRGDGVSVTFDGPVYHNWNGETSGAHPSHVSTDPIAGGSHMDVSTVVTAPWTRSIQGVTSTSPEAAFVDLGSEFGVNDPGVRVQVTCKPTGSANAFVDVHISASTDVWEDDFLWWRIQENESKYYHARRFGGVYDFNESPTFASGTGNSALHYRFEQLKAGNTSWSCLDFGGSTVFSQTAAFPGTLEVFPAGMRYLGLEGVNGGNIYVYQIWVGLSTDAWPSLPMNPMTNL